MAIVISSRAGKTFQPGEKVTNAKLNQLGNPVVQISGTQGPEETAPGDYSGVFTAGAYFYGLDTGSVNAARVNLDPAVSAYGDGLLVVFKVAVENTGAVTLAVNGLPAQPVKKHGNLDLERGDWKRGQIVAVRYRLDANVVPAAAVYSGAGSYTLTVIPGQVYIWTKGLSDTSLVNGAQTLLASAGFTAEGTTVTLTGNISVAITATVVPSSNVWQQLSQLGNAPYRPAPFQGAGTFLAGQEGLVPAPGVGSTRKYLRDDGEWVDVVAEAGAAANATSIEVFKALNFY